MTQAKLQFISQTVDGQYISMRYCIQWEYGDGTVRTPEETYLRFAHPGAFTAAGRQYSSLQELCAQKTAAQGRLCRDIHGREVLAVREPFPRFEHLGSLNENRFYRWFFIRQSDRITAVFHTDGADQLLVVEDVRVLRETDWKLMQEVSWQEV